jgi:hypothetical protein
MFFAGEALYAGPDVGTVGQRPRDGADDHDRVSADTTPRPLKLRTEELLAEPGILEAPAIEQAIDHDRDPVHRR